MVKTKSGYLFLILWCICSTFAKNFDRSYAYVVSDATGRYFIKSEPRVESPLTTVGNTTVYQVSEHNNRELAKFNWFCGALNLFIENDTIYIQCHNRHQVSVSLTNRDFGSGRPAPTITPYITGRYYINSIPKSSKNYSTIGSTIAYKVEKFTDREIVRYNWYCKDLYLFSINDSLYAVRLNTRLQGTAANYSDVAIAFYHNKRKIKEYSTLAIAQHPYNILRSDFSYSVVSLAPELMFYDLPEPDECIFTIMTIDRRYLHFDVRTGDMLDDNGE